MEPKKVSIINKGYLFFGNQGHADIEKVPDENNLKKIFEWQFDDLWMSRAKIIVH